MKCCFYSFFKSFFCSAKEIWRSWVGTEAVGKRWLEVETAGGVWSEQHKTVIVKPSDCYDDDDGIVACYVAFDAPIFYYLVHVTASVYTVNVGFSIYCCVHVYVVTSLRGLYWHSVHIYRWIRSRGECHKLFCTGNIYVIGAKSEILIKCFIVTKPIIDLNIHNSFWLSHKLIKLLLENFMYKFLTKNWC